MRRILLLLDVFSNGNWLNGIAENIPFVWSGSNGNPPEPSGPNQLTQTLDVAGGISVFSGLPSASPSEVGFQFQDPLLTGYFFDTGRRLPTPPFSTSLIYCVEKQLTPGSGLTMFMFLLLVQPQVPCSGSLG